MNARLRPYRPDDGSALAEVCIRTGDAGRDASSLYSIPTLLPDLFMQPYVFRHPDFAFVVDVDGVARGYVVCAPDTAAFEQWFARDWWPRRRPDLVRSECTDHDRMMLAYADARGRVTSPYASVYPAHLHIDLLPEVRGQGWGRRLMDALISRLGEKRVPGLHLVTGAGNGNAAGFYGHLGLQSLPADPGARAFGVRIPPRDAPEPERR